MGEKVENIMDRKIREMKTMRQVLEKFEEYLEGKRVFRYMEGNSVRDVFADQFFFDVRGAASLLWREGLVGKHIGIMGSNSYIWMVCLCSVFWTGSVAVLFDRELNENELCTRARRVELDALFYEDNLKEHICRAKLPDGVRMMPFGQVKETSEFESNREENLDKDGDDLACIFFTSGTTAVSKAVMMSEHGLVAGICHSINDRKFRSLLAVLPFHHLSGFSSVLNALYLGAEVCIAGDLKYFYRYLEVMKPEYVFVVPSMLRMLARKLKNGGPNGRLLGWNLRLINCGGADFCPEFLQVFLECGVVVLQGYGASEAGGIGFLWEMTTEHPDTIGKPTAQIKVKIVDGELYLHSESLMLGYYGDEAATALVLHDGWYATGDLCKADHEGYLYLTGRKKNLIVLSNGENISPEAVEKKLYQFKEICEVVVSVEGNLLAAAVLPRYPEECTEQETEQIRQKVSQDIEQYNQSVPLYEQIQLLHFMNMPMEKTSLGKMIRPRFSCRSE